METILFQINDSVKKTYEKENLHGEWELNLERCNLI